MPERNREVYMGSFEDSLSSLLENLYRELNELEEKMLTASKLNLSISEIHMLEAVQNAGGGEGATISELSEYLAISLPSVTLSVNKLVKKAYVTRQRCREDGRVVRVALTKTGRKAERAHRYFHRSMVREIASGMNENEKLALVHGIEKLDGFLKKNIEKYNMDN